MFVRAAGGEGGAGFSFYELHSAGKKNFSYPLGSRSFFCCCFFEMGKVKIKKQHLPTELFLADSGQLSTTGDSPLPVIQHYSCWDHGRRRELLPSLTGSSYGFFLFFYRT